MRSRSFSPQRRPDWNVRQRALVARLSEGAIGRALAFDLEKYIAARAHALVMLRSALRGGEHSELFKVDRKLPAGSRWPRENRSSFADALFAPAGSSVSAVGDAAVGPQHGYSGRAQEDGRGGGLCVDPACIRRVGGSGARDAAKPVAVFVAGCVCDSAGKHVLRPGLFLNGRIRTLVTGWNCQNIAIFFTSVIR